MQQQVRQTPGANGASSRAKRPDSSSFVLFGATGDLAKRLVIPALYNLFTQDLLPETFVIIGIVRSEADASTLKDELLQGLKQFGKCVDDAKADELMQRFAVAEADPAQPKTFDQLGDRLDDIEKKHGTAGNRLFYLATPPTAFTIIASQLARIGQFDEDKCWRRLIVEKPFGTDLESAHVLNDHLLSLLTERQIYRIDHYLGKETVQNILVLRFANGIFEPIWNRNHIDHIQITVEEKIGVGHRGSFYDATGALRDMVPNHLFQLLSLIAMEPPSKFDAHEVRSEKAQVLGAIQLQTEQEALQNSVRGQYLAGMVDDDAVADYTETRNVKPDSTTETYAALKLTIDNWRWAGVPFYLRTGKALKAKRTEVAIKFKQAPFAMFRDTSVDSLAENYLVIGVEPSECITLQFNTKIPGPSVRIGGVAMDFFYKDYFNATPSNGYETLIYDCMIGDNILFQRADSVEAGWTAVQPFIDAWHKAGQDGLESYRAGTEGPAQADELLARDGRSWRIP